MSHLTLVDRYPTECETFGCKVVGLAERQALAELPVSFTKKPAQGEYPGAARRSGKPCCVAPGRGIDDLRSLALGYRAPATSQCNARRLTPSSKRRPAASESSVLEAGERLDGYL